MIFVDVNIIKIILKQYKEGSNYFLSVNTNDIYILNITEYHIISIKPNWLSRLAARSRKGQVSALKPGWERLSFCTSGARDGCCQMSLRFRREYWQLKGPLGGRSFGAS